MRGIPAKKICHIQRDQKRLKNGAFCPEKVEIQALAEKYLAQKELSPDELATVHKLIAKYYKQWS